MALTKHKVCRSNPTKADMVSPVPQGRRSGPEDGDEHGEENPSDLQGGYDDVDELSASGAASAKSWGELVGTAEVDWR